ncbi:Uncharacterised protein [Vibrio cholerae]|nr:Uncharacterised protein [Vibrio cholerae]
MRKILLLDVSKKRKRIFAVLGVNFSFITKSH